MEILGIILLVLVFAAGIAIGARFRKNDNFYPEMPGYEEDNVIDAESLVMIAFHTPAQRDTFLAWFDGAGEQDYFASKQQASEGDEYVDSFHVDHEQAVIYTEPSNVPTDEATRAVEEQDMFGLPDINYGPLNK